MKGILLYAVLFFQLVGCIFAGAQINFRLTGETGLYEDKILRKSDIFLRLEGQTLFKYQIKDIAASLQVRAIPSYYNADSDIQSLKLFSRAMIDFTKPSYALSFEGIKRVYHFTGYFDYIRGDLQLLQIKIIAAKNRMFSLALSSGLGQEDIFTIRHYLRDMWFAELKLIHSLFKSFKINYGFYYENFLLHHDGNYDMEQNANKGMRFGPEIRFSYFSQFWITLEYRYLRHTSDLVGHNSYEGNLRVFLGKAVNSYLTILLLVDYYQRRFVLEQPNISDINLLYSPMDMENRIYVKTVFTISDNSEFYIRFGYGKESFRQQLFHLEGWRTVVGISFKY
jgi:hypothetical protein